MVDSKSQWKAWLYLAPAIILLLVFTVWPIFNTLIMAFSDNYKSLVDVRRFNENTDITVYGTVESNEDGWITLDKDARFYYSASDKPVESNDSTEVEKLAKGGGVGDYVVLMGVISEDGGDFDKGNMTGKFALNVGKGKVIVDCSDGIKEMTYDLGVSAEYKDIYVTGKIQRNGSKYVMKDANYVAAVNVSLSQKEKYGESQAANVEKALALADGETTEEMTFAGVVYTFDGIVDSGKINIHCQITGADSSQMMIVDMQGLNAKERTGLRFGTFFAGIGNFKRVVNLAGFGRNLVNTLLLCVLTVPISTMLALLIAVCLNAIKPLKRLLQTIFFLPYVTNSIAIGMVFATMFNIIGYNPADINKSLSLGVINNFIQLFGGQPISWINQGSSYAANIAVMTIYIVWNALPFKILILLGGLQSVNKQYYDAAKVDGTSRTRTFFRITIPLLSPMLAYVIITGFIGGFKEYSSIVGIFGEKMGPTGDPGRLNTMVGYIYEAIESDSQGVASAGALILFCIILVVTLINLQVSKRKVHY